MDRMARFTRNPWYNLLVALYPYASVTSVTCVTKVNDILHFRDETYGFSKSDQDFMIFFVGLKQYIHTNFQRKLSCYNRPFSEEAEIVSTICGDERSAE